MDFKEKVKKFPQHFGAAPWANCLAFAGQFWPAGR